MLLRHNFLQCIELVLKEYNTFALKIMGFNFPGNFLSKMSFLRGLNFKEHNI